LVEKEKNTEYTEKKNKKEMATDKHPGTVIPPYPDTVILPYGAGRTGG